MKCPYCGDSNRDQVLETRSALDGAAIKRRRLCHGCGRRFTTVEEVAELELYVVKSDGRREPFDRNKIVRGMKLAATGRPIGIEALEEMAEDVQRVLTNRMEREAGSQEIGTLVMERLRKVDHVAYVRFASVYLQFEDAAEFRDIADKLRERRERSARC
ncbi:MAG: transcriptional regulator NrdR [Armatimonadetes bacterium]|nr:transcriptional regulator NrdR [Armatimonadota bacterium]MDE2206564.1 transcriptional regulator NrdR [Armatimonadota bacterium]